MSDGHQDPGGGPYESPQAEMGEPKPGGMPSKEECSSAMLAVEPIALSLKALGVPHPAGFEHRGQSLDTPLRCGRESCMDACVERHLMRRLVDDGVGVVLF